MKQMAADGLTKLLFVPAFQLFIRMLELYGTWFYKA